MTTKDNLFRSKRPEDKISRTNSAAREIIDAEDDERRSKTERLRLARLQMEADAPPVEAPKARRKTTPAINRIRPMSA